MRICYIATGISLHAQRWVNYFARKGHEVHLISHRFPVEYEGYDKSIQFHPLVRLAPKIWAISRYPSALLWLFKVRRLINKIKPDVLDAHFIGINAYLAVVSGFHPLILTAWGSDILIIPKQNPLWRNLTKYAIRRADFLISWSSVIKEALLNFGAQESRMSVVFLGVDTHQFNSTQREERLRQRLGASKSPIVISTRTLSPLYSVDTLIQAIPLVLAEIPETKFVIIGDGNQKDYLVKLAADKGIMNAVKFLGRVPHEELPKYLASSDIYVSTSLSDGTSISLLEAMACKLAPVVTDIPANRNWVAEGKNGFLFPIKNHKILAEKIIFLLKDKGARYSFGAIGESLVAEHAQYEQQMEKVEEIYQSLVNKVNSC